MAVLSVSSGTNRNDRNGVIQLFNPYPGVAWMAVIIVDAGGGNVWFGKAAANRRRILPRRWWCPWWKMCGQQDQHEPFSNRDKTASIGAIEPSNVLE